MVQDKLLNEFIELYELVDKDIPVELKATDNNLFHTQSYCVECGKEANMGNGFCSISCMNRHFGA